MEKIVLEDFHSHALSPNKGDRIYLMRRVKEDLKRLQVSARVT